MLLNLEPANVVGRNFYHEEIIMKIGNYYHHGDVLIKNADIPQEAKKQKKSNDVVLAEGEATGHKHVLAECAEKVEIYKHNNIIYLKINESVKLKHEEHKSFVIKNDGKTKYIDRVKEFDPWQEEIRKVQD